MISENNPELWVKIFKDVTFGSGVQIIRYNSVSIEPGCVIADHVWINACISTYPQFSIEIGHKTLIGRRSMISSGLPIKIGAYCVLAPNVYISNADHGFNDVTQPILQQPITSHGELIIEDNCWLGINSAIIGAVTIGRCSIIGANSVVLHSTPPFSVVVGNPARVVKIWSFRSKQWITVSSQKELQTILQERETFPPPDQNQYREILHKQCSFANIPEVIAGRGQWLADHFQEKAPSLSISAFKTFFENQDPLMTTNNYLRSVISLKKNFYNPVALTPSTFVKIATSPDTWKAILEFHNQLASDEYVAYLDTWYRECLSRFGKDWFYLDIVNVLYTAARTLKPRNYLEIGVRRGRSACVVCKGYNPVNITAIDLWQVNYAGMENPGPQFVKQELQKHGHTGSIEFLNGNSHELLPQIFKKNPHLEYDLITVDGDHSESGAAQDLLDVIPHLSMGGILVFDDIAHPSHPYLLKVWHQVTSQFPDLACFEFSEIGYGVAFAIRRGSSI